MRITLPVLLVVALSGCGRPLPRLGEVPHFQLTDQSGKTYDSTVLDGHVWVADFVFTNCEGPCPRMTSHMHQLQTRTDKDIRLVSFTVDPARDTPPVLQEYARHFEAQPGKWFFLTGAVPDLNRMSKGVFMLGDVDGSLEHSTRFALIDQQSRIRGYYLTSEQDAIPNLISDARRLLKGSAL